ncbi:hypothetical protein [Actinoplanes sp. N902-109]|uniref:hypothetical protein n=1 Tax=Actinoplanes sp. (strain N902-109) TaxID=649831 RepID=UPI0018DCFECD|nr:hypothetical protein [Actinoplanes sp. N902-109]
MPVSKSSSGSRASSGCSTAKSLHWDKVVAAEPADLAFDAAFLVGSFDAWLAVEDIQAVMGAERGPALGLDALP